MMTARCSLLLVAACGGTPTPQPPPEITFHAPATPAAPEHDHIRANQILRAYGAEHALGMQRRAPTAAELAAAAAADPFDDVTADAWRAMDPQMRMLRAYAAGQHDAWDAVCLPAVERWWGAAKTIDDELVDRLAQPVPADLYGGLAAFSLHRAWLKQRMTDPAFASLPKSGDGPYHRLAAAQLAWAETWRDQPVAHAVAVAAIRDDGWPLDSLAVEQSRFCTATWLHTSRVWPPVLHSPIRIQQPHNTLLPSQEWGTVATVDASGSQLTVKRRDRETTIVSVPPCKRVRCTGIDCAMDDRHGWRDICVQKEVHRTVARSWTLHVITPPVPPKVGDQVRFYLDPPTGAAVLSSVAHSKQEPYFALTVY